MARKKNTPVICKGKLVYHTKTLTDYKIFKTL